MSRAPQARNRCRLPRDGKPPQTICVVDPNPADYEGWAALANAQGVCLKFASAAEEALRINRSTPIHLWVVSTELPGRSGLELCEMLRSRVAAAPVYLVADSYSAEIEAAAWQALQGPDAPPLALMTEDRNPTIRLQATVALRWLELGPAQQEQVIRRLDELLDDRNGAVRIQALVTLGVVGPRSGLVKLGHVREAVEDRDALVRIRAVETLGRFGPKAEQRDRPVIPAVCVDLSQDS